MATLILVTTLMLTSPFSGGFADTRGMLSVHGSRQADLLLISGKGIMLGELTPISPDLVRYGVQAASLSRQSPGTDGTPLESGGSRMAYRNWLGAIHVYEGQKLVQVAREKKKVLQIGSQNRSNAFKMRAMAAVQGGLIGKVYQSKGLCYKRRASIGKKPDVETPPGVNWEMFLGPAPLRPFKELSFRYNWQWFWNTGNGDIGNQGVHELGIARWGLSEPGWPKGVHAHGGEFAYDDDRETPNTLTANYDFGGRELVFEVRGLLTGAGATAPNTVAPLNIMVGNLFYGTEGWAAMSDAGFQAFKGESNELIMEEKPERGGPHGNPTGLHMQNFLAAIKSRNYKDLHDEIGIAYLSASMCHLANISYRVGRKLTLANGPKFVNDPAATKLLTRDYRQPYTV